MVVVLLIAAAVISLFIWQKNNISAVISASKYSDEDIEQQITDSKKNVEDQLKDYNVTGLRDFTIEEEEDIRKGKLSVEEAVEKILRESNIGQAEKTDDMQGQKPQNKTGNSSSEIVSDYTVKLYSLKASYLGQIGNLIDEAKADYKGGASASELMSNYLGRAASLEKEADSQVDSLLRELKTKLNEIGADTGIVNTMKSSYANEKSLKKSYYLSLFNKKK